MPLSTPPAFLETSSGRDAPENPSRFLWCLLLGRYGVSFQHGSVLVFARRSVPEASLGLRIMMAVEWFGRYEAKPPIDRPIFITHAFLSIQATVSSFLGQLSSYQAVPSFLENVPISTK